MLKKIKEKLKEHKLLIMVLFIIIFVFMLILIFLFSKKDVFNSLKEINLNKYDNLMIVAHPDDEMLWAGIELIRKDYLVVCITCGKNIIRNEEFKKVMKETNDKYIFLFYPDKILFLKSNWKFSQKYIEKDLNKIINYKSWKKIVTHNEEGEYGHIHHIKTHNMVSAIAQKDKLKFFGTYCAKKDLENENCLFTKNIFQEKKYIDKKGKILYKYYKSQKRTINKFKHILAYEKIE